MTEIVDTIFAVENFPYNILESGRLSTARDPKSKQFYILNKFMTFDIETTSVNAFEEHDAFMYLWQACLGGYVIMGRTWETCLRFFEEVRRYIDPYRLVVYSHNLSFEFQFLRSLVDVNSVFATEKRKILKALINDVFEFRCSWRLTNMSLSRFLKSSPNVPDKYLKGENFDYNKFRTPSTHLNRSELQYGFNDVAGLYLAIEHKMADEGDNLITIPLTSTGYVRREARKAMFEGKGGQYNRHLISGLVMTPNCYSMCKQASRGGNCHANPTYSGEQIVSKDGRTPIAKSKDMSSAYPAGMLQRKFPMSQFLQSSDFPNLKPEKAYLLEIELYNVQVSTIDTIPYIAAAKCAHKMSALLDNGRVLKAEFLHLFITDIDWKIMKSQYDFDAVCVTEYSANYGYLPDAYRKYIFDRYIRKCDLKFGDKYYYSKEKNKINALFGMMLTDVIHPEIEYLGSPEAPYLVHEPDLSTALKDLKKSKNNFLAYQWGVWVTAHCRQRLQKAIDTLLLRGIEVLYCDTDSVKFLYNPSNNDIIEDTFRELNDEILAETRECGFNTTYTTHGKTFNLGLWEDDGDFIEFKTLGAKKYYIKDVDNRQEITVAGLSKSSGLSYLTKIGGINAFKPGTIVPPQYSGRTAAHYIDTAGPRYIKLQDEKFLAGSGIAIENTSYTFNLSDDYELLLNNIHNPDANSIATSLDEVFAKPTF